MQILLRLSNLSQIEFGNKVGVKRTTIKEQCKKGVNIERFFEYCEKVSVDPAEVIEYRKQLNKDNGK